MGRCASCPRAGKAWARSGRGHGIWTLAERGRPHADAPEHEAQSPEAAESDDAGGPTSPEPAAAPLVPVPHEQDAESLFAALAAEADEETAGA